MISRTHLPFNCCIWPLLISDGAGRHQWAIMTSTVTALPCVAVPDVLELQYQLESKQPNGTPQLVLPLCLSQSLWQQGASRSLLLCEGVSNIPGIDCPRGGSTALPFVMDFFRLHWNRVMLLNVCITLKTSSLQMQKKG